jgi:hypothetical protein
MNRDLKIKWHQGVRAGLVGQWKQNEKDRAEIEKAKKLNPKKAANETSEYSEGYLHGFSDALAREIKWQELIIKELEEDEG